MLLFLKERSDKTSMSPDLGAHKLRLKRPALCLRLNRARAGTPRAELREIALKAVTVLCSSELK